MNFPPILRACFIWLLVFSLMPLLSGTAAEAADLKLEAILVWATNAERSPDPNHKPVNDEIRRKLTKDLPLKWKNYFEVKRVDLSVARSGSREAALSDKCKVAVKDIDGKHIEVSVIGKDKPELKKILPLLKGELVPLLGGNSPGDTGWIVLLKRVE